MDIKREIVLSIKGVNYTINFPTIGQNIRIESLKQQFSDGQYANMVLSGMKSQSKALDAIDVLSYFTVLLPKEFFKDLNVASLEQIDAIDFQELIKVYKETFKPWINEWYKLIEKQDEDK